MQCEAETRAKLKQGAVLTKKLSRYNNLFAQLIELLEEDIASADQKIQQQTTQKEEKIKHLIEVFDDI